MFRSVCSLSLTTFAHDFRSRGAVIGRDIGKLRRIFIFIFYWILILLLLFLPLYIKTGGREREIHYLTFFTPILYLSQGRGKGDTLVENFLALLNVNVKGGAGEYISGKNFFY